MFPLRKDGILTPSSQILNFQVYSMEKQVYMSQIFHAKCVQPHIKAEAEKKKQELAAKLSGEPVPTKEPAKVTPEPIPQPTVQPTAQPTTVQPTTTAQPATTTAPVNAQARPVLADKFCPYCGVERTDTADNFCGDCGGNLKA